MARSFRKQLQASAQLWRAFRETPPRRARVINFVVPKTLTVMGYFTRFDYTTTHGEKVTLYKHPFARGSRPRFCAAPDGRIFVIGGRFRVNGRGIVDLDGYRRVIEPRKRTRR